MTVTYHIEALGLSQSAKAVPIVQRLSIRTDNLDSVQRRAVRLLHSSRSPQWSLPAVEAVRIVDGAGSELFRWSLWDELSRTGQK